MDLITAYDPYVLFSLSFALLLTLCVAIMALMRDPYSVPPYPVSRRVWCEAKHQSADVDFVESVVTGMVHRSVQQCSLRGSDGRCDGACCYEPAAKMVPARTEA